MSVVFDVAEKVHNRNVEVASADAIRAQRRADARDDRLGIPESQDI